LQHRANYVSKCASYDKTLDFVLLFLYFLISGIQNNVRRDNSEKVSDTFWDSSLDPCIVLCAGHQRLCLHLYHTSAGRARRPGALQKI